MPIDPIPPQDSSPERLPDQATDDQPTRAFESAEIAESGPRPPEPLPDQRLIGGRYKLLQKLGEGGMGTVWQAEQTEPIKRLVAVKIIKAGLDSERTLARFEAERQALAMMDHPNIAKVFDAGSLGEPPHPGPLPRSGGEGEDRVYPLSPASGERAGVRGSSRPYFVMELVKGLPITKYCEQHHLTPQQRLELFIPVCQAVQHAHQKGIIHRDLKPSNILVAIYDGKPIPKVIDFGIAKATAQKLTEKTLFTEVGQIIGTLEYMAPEQAELNNLDIDTRADIYALGVVLYELLTGSTPFTGKQLREAGFAEMLRIIREVEPSKPSTKLSAAPTVAEGAAGVRARSAARPAARPPRLYELDWIVMKCLEKDRSRRYETANGLAMDVQRYLSDEPVQASPPSAGYRLRKFVRRNRGPVMAGLAVIMALAVGGVVSYSKYLDAKEQERIAVKAREAEEEQVKERDKVIGERDEAIGKRDKALSDAKDALDREAERVVERDKANKELTQQLGNSNFLLAVAAYDNRNAAGAANRLRQVPLSERRWEWAYLMRQVRGGIFALSGHTNTVTSVSFSPDGSRIVTGSYDRTAKVWDARTGTFLLELNGHINGIASVSFSPDGTRIVTGGGGGNSSAEAKVWDARTGKRLLELVGHTRGVISVRFSPDGSRIVTASWDRTAKVWDARTGMLLLNLRGYRGYVRSASFSPDGTRIVIGSDRETAKVFDARTGKYLLNLTGHSLGTDSASFSPDGTRIVTGSGNTAWVWDARTGTPLLELKGHTDSVMSVSFSPDGARIVTGSADQTAKVWDARTGAPLLELKEMSWVLGVSFSPDGARIVTGSDKTAKVWDARTGTPRVDLQGHTGWVHSVNFSPDGSRLVTGSGTFGPGEAKVWDARSGALLLDLKKGQTGPIYSACFSPDGTRIVTADVPAKIWDAQTGEFLLVLDGMRRVSSACFSPDGMRIVAGSDKTARVWDARTGKPLFDLKGQRNNLSSVNFSPDGTRIISTTSAPRGTNDPCEVKIWDAQDGTPLFAFQGPTRGVRNVGFSPDGTRFVTDYGMIAMLWDARSGKPLLELKGHTDQVTSVSFSPDGTRIVTGSSDKTARVWDARTGTPLLELKGHTNTVTSVSFSPDGARIATGGWDRKVKVWDAHTGQELAGDQPLNIEERDYRLLHTRPNHQRYSEGYDAAKKANDRFAAQFYLDRILTFSEHRTTARFQERNALQPEPLVITRTGFHHPALAKTPYDRGTVALLAIHGDHLAKRLVAQQLLRDGKSESAIPLLLECLLSRPITHPPKPPVEELLLAQAYLDLKDLEQAKRFYRAANDWLERYENPIRAMNVVSHAALNPWAALGQAFVPVDDPRRNPFDWESWHECDVFRAQVEAKLK